MLVRPPAATLSEEDAQMNRLFLIALPVSLAMLSACASPPPAHQAEAAAASPARKQAASDKALIRDEAGTAVLQKVEFRSGVSSATVERLARRFGCTGTVGAGLVTEKGPVEVYRMRCDNGTTFLAQCELRQCRPLR
jgi:hypothetical protein